MTSCSLTLLHSTIHAYGTPGTGVSRRVLNEVCHRDRVAVYLQQTPAYLPLGLCGNWDPCPPLVSLKQLFIGARQVYLFFLFFLIIREG